MLAQGKKTTRTLIKKGGKKGEGKKGEGKKEDGKKKHFKKCEILQIPLMAAIMVPPVWGGHVTAVLNHHSRDGGSNSHPRAGSRFRQQELPPPPRRVRDGRRSEDASPRSAAETAPGICSLPPIRGEDKHRWCVLISRLHGD